MKDYTHISMPLAVKNVVSLNDNQLVNGTKYRAIIGSLKSLTFFCLGIIHVVNQVY